MTFDGSCGSHFYYLSRRLCDDVGYPCHAPGLLETSTYTEKLIQSYVYVLRIRSTSLYTYTTCAVDNVYPPHTCRRSCSAFALLTRPTHTAPAYTFTAHLESYIRIYIRIRPTYISRTRPTLVRPSYVVPLKLPFIYMYTSRCGCPYTFRGTFLSCGDCAPCQDRHADTFNCFLFLYTYKLYVYIYVYVIRISICISFSLLILSRKRNIISINFLRPRILTF